MRRAGTLDVPTGLGAGDHVCWCYADRDRLRAEVVLYLAEGEEGGDRLWYVGPAPRQALLEDLALLAGRDEMLGSGQLRVDRAEDVYGPPERFDPVATLRRLAGAAAEAVADGFRGLRMATDVTHLLAHPDLIAYELACDPLLAGSPCTVLCAYPDTGEPPMPAVRSVHPVVSRESTMFSLFWDAEAFRVTGELDLSVATELTAAGAAAASVCDGELVLDLRDLQFLDAGAARVLAQLTLAAEVEGTGVRFRSPRTGVLRSLDAFGLTSRVEP